VTKSDGVVDVGMLEHAIRDDLDKNAPRAMCVLNPLKVVLTNYPEDKTEVMTAAGHPNRDDLGERILPFSQQIYIDQDDFREEANKKYKRLVVGKRVRLRNAYVIEADSCIKDDSGNIIEVHARVIEGTLGNNPEDGIKPKGVIQWVDSKQHATFDTALYDRLFTDESPDSGDKNFLDTINPNSVEKKLACIGEIGLLDAPIGVTYQFEREGYFCKDSHAETLLFNRTIGLRDTFVG